MKARHLSIVPKKEFRGLFNERRILLGVTGAVTILLGYATQKYAERVGKSHHSG